MEAATASWLIPSIIGGVGAAAQMMHGGGAEGSLYGYGRDEAGFAPTRASIEPTLLGGALRPIEQMAGVAMGRLREPTPYIPPPGLLPSFGSNYFMDPETGVRRRRRRSSTMFSPVMVTHTDPGLRRAGLTQFPGVNVGTGPLTQEYTGRPTPEGQWGTVDQPDPTGPAFGFNLPRVQNALHLLNESRVEDDAFRGNINEGGTGLFTGADFGKTITRTTDPEYEAEWKRRQGDTEYDDTLPPDAGSFTTEPECTAAGYTWDPILNTCQG